MKGKGQVGPVALAVSLALMLATGEADAKSNSQSLKVRNPGAIIGGDAIIGSDAIIGGDRLKVDRKSVCRERVYLRV